MSGVEIRVRANTADARRDLSRLERSVGNIESSVQKTTKAFSRMLVGIGATLASGALTKSINNATDAMTNFQNRLALVTGRGAELNKTLNSIFEVSKRTRGSIEGSVEVFNRFGLALNKSEKSVNRWGRETIKQTTVSSDKLIMAVENVNKAVAISGTGAESAKAALIQLGQGLASGQLRGQELNSVLEQAPRLAQAIADEMEVPYGSLRKLAEQGRITSDVVFSALINQGEKLTKEFELMEGTAGQAMSVLRDQVGRLTADVSKQLNITTGFTRRVNELSDLIEANRVAIAAGIVDTARNMSQTFSGTLAVMSAVLDVLTAIGGRALDALPRAIVPMRDLINTVSVVGVGAFLNLSRWITRANLDFSALVANFTGTGFQGAFRRIFTSGSLDELAMNLQGLAKAIDTYGRRWYNLGNNLEALFRSSQVWLLKTGIYVGILEQRLLSFRYTSFERFSKVIPAIANGFNQILQSVKSSQAFINLQLALFQIVQLLVNVGSAIDNAFGAPVTRAVSSITRLFGGLTSSAKSSLSGTWDLVNKYLSKIERKFFWLYDEVIANSWWTDTMEGVYYKARTWLGATSDYITGFLSRTEQKFRSLNKEFLKLMALPKKSKSGAIKLKIEITKENAKETLKNYGTAVAELVRDGLTTVQRISPTALSWLTIATSGALLSAVSPELFKKVGKFVGPVLALTIAGAVLNSLGTVFNKANIGTLIGTGLGVAVANAFNQVFQALPEITRALIQLAKGFGTALADELGLNIFTAIPKLIGSIPVAGGLMNTILFGGLTAAFFFKGVRGFMLNAIIGVLTNPALSVGAGGPLISRLLVGTPGDRAKMLGIVGGTVFAANALVGDIIGSGAATALGLGGGIILNMLLAGSTPSQIIAQITALTTAIASRVSGMWAYIVASSTTGWISTLVMQIRTIGLAGSLSALQFGTSWRVAFAAVLAKGTQVASALIARFAALSGALKVGTFLAALLVGSAAFAGTTEGAEEASSSLMNLGFVAVLVTPLILDLFKLLSKITVIGTLFASVGTSIAAFGGAIVGTLGAIGAGILAIPGVVVATVATLAAIGTGLIYSIFFGKGDTWGERIKNNFDALVKRTGQFFGFFKRGTYGLRKELQAVLSSVEQNLGAIDIDVNLVSKLKDVDLSSLGGRERDEILASSRNLEKLTVRAAREAAVFGTASEETRKLIKNAVESIDKKTLEAGAEGRTQEERSFGAFFDIAEIFTNASTSPITKAMAVGINAEMNAQAARGESRNPGAAADTFRAGAGAGFSEFFKAQKELLDSVDAGSITDVIERARAADTGSDEQLRLIETILGTILGATGALESGGVDVSEQPEYAALFAVLEAFTKGNYSLSVSLLDALDDTRGYFGGLDPEGSPEIVGEAIRSVLAVNNENLSSQRTALLDTIKEGLEGLELDSIEGIERLPLDILREIAAGIRQTDLAGGAFDATQRTGESAEEYNIRLKSGASEADQAAYATALTDLESVIVSAAQAIAKGGEAAGADFRSLDTASLSGRLGDQGISGIEAGAGRYGELLEIDRLLTGIQEKEREIARLSKDTNIPLVERTSKINELNDLIQTSTTTLEQQVQSVNDGNIMMSERVGLISDAASGFEKFDIDVNKLLAVDSATLDTIIAAQANLIGLNNELAATAILGGQARSGITAEIADIEATLAAIFDKLGKGRIGTKPSTRGGGTTQTAFEKFTGTLGDIGFDFDIDDTLGMSAKSMGELVGYTQEYRELQKQVNKLAVEDVATRERLLDRMRDVRDQTGEALAGSTFGNLGSFLDSSSASIDITDILKNPANNVKQIVADTLRLREIEEEIAGLTIEQIDRARELFEEVEKIKEGLGDQDAGGSFAERFKNDFQSGLTEALKTGDFKAFGELLLDSFTTSVIESFSQGITDGIFGENGLLTSLFGRISDWGKSLAEGATAAIETGATGEGEGGSFLAGLFKNLGSFFKDIFEGVMGFLQALGGGGGGSIPLNSGGVVPGGSGFQMLNSGGLVNPQIGKDSVPVMLTPGEYVVNSKKTADMMKNMSGGQQQQVYNINVQGDVSRQTRSEIVKMLPQITQGVNMNNKERNYRGR